MASLRRSLFAGEVCFVYEFSERLAPEGRNGTKADYAAQGYLELLHEQLTLASDEAELIVGLFKTGRTDELKTALQEMGRRLADAFLSYQSVSLLIEKDDDDDRIGPL